MESRTRKTNQAGFTMVEVLVTIAIMGLMMTAVTQMLTSVRFARDLVHNEQEQYLAGPAILDMIERDLRGAYVTGFPRIDHFRVEDNVIGGADADRIDFISTTNSLVEYEDGGDFLRADINEVGYCLRSNPLDQDFLELYRREGFGIDDDPHSDGRYIFLNDRVRNFNIEVFALRGPEDELDPLDDWGLDESDEDILGLPAFIRVTLEIELEPRLLRETLLYTKQLRTYERIISFPEELRFAQEADIPRFVIPTGTGSTGGDPSTEPGGDDVDETEVGGAGGGGFGGGGGGGGGRGDIQGEQTEGGGGG